MGNSASSGKGAHQTADRLTAWDLFTFERQFKFTVAELEYLYARYGDLRNTVYGLQEDSKDSAKATGASRGELAESPQGLAYDWLMRQIYRTLFPQQDAAGSLPTFEAFLKAITWWRDETVQRKLEFVFSILNINKDKKLSVLDLSYILHAVSSYTIQREDVVRVRGENRLGTVKYVGPISGRKGTWAGLEMPGETGNNDGSVGKDRYFTCDPRRGVFVLLEKVDLDQVYQTAEKIMAPLDRKGRGYLTQHDFVNALITEEWVKEKLAFRLLPAELRSATTVDLA